MTANELIDSAKDIHTTIEALEWAQKAATMLRQQQAEIEALKKELALQRLSDIGQAIERELTDEEIAEIYHCEPRFSPQGNFAYLNFARAILKKASEK